MAPSRADRVHNKGYNKMRFVITPEAAEIAMQAPTDQKNCPFCETPVGKESSVPWTFSKEQVTPGQYIWGKEALVAHPELNGVMFFVAPHADCLPSQLMAMYAGLRFRTTA